MTSKVTHQLTVHPRWICGVVRSGYHNGSCCLPADPHSGWGCGYRYEISVPATPETREMLEAHGIQVYED